MTFPHRELDEYLTTDPNEYLPEDEMTGEEIRQAVLKEIKEAVEKLEYPEPKNESHYHGGVAPCPDAQERRGYQRAINDVLELLK